VTRVERGGGGHGERATSGGTSAAETQGRGNERAGDWRIDQMLLSAMGLGDLSQVEQGASPTAVASEGASEVDRERQSEALEAAAADREARKRDPVVLYLDIHSNSVAHAVAAMLQVHQDEWPAPAPEITWRDAARFTRKMVRTLCPVVRDDSFALFQLVHPLRPDDAYRRHVAGARAARTTWIPGFGEAVAAQVKAAIFPSIERLGARFQAAAAAGNGEPPAASKIGTSHPLDTYVRSAMAEQGVLEYSLVSRGAASPETQTRANRRRAREERAEAGDDARDSGATAKPQLLTLQWLGREDAKLWNYVRVSPPSATAEEVAAALYGHPAQSRMAFALQRHGDLFQVAPKQARELIASRYPGEVTGHGTARDGAALAGSPLGDELALRETSSSTTTAAAHARLPAKASGASTSSSVASPADATTGESVTLPQLMELHVAIFAELEKLRAIVAPVGLASRLKPAFAFRARTMLEATDADAVERQQWRHVWHAQHIHLMMIAAAVPPLAAQAATTTASPTTDRAAAARARLSKYLAAAAISHLKSSCAAVLAELEAERRQELLDQATDSQIGLHDALRQANATPGQTTERGSEETDAALTRAQARVLRGASPEKLQDAQLAAEEVALRTRLDTVRLALIDLGAAADEAGHGLSSQLASLGSGKFRSLPALIDAIQLRLHDVERQWAAAERNAATFDVAADDRAAELQKQQARAVGLDAARQAFSTLANDQDLGTFLRESQKVVSSQQFRSGIVKLAGALVITVATSGMAAQLGAGLSGLVGAGEAGGALTAGALAARAGGAALNLAVNVTVNSALQYAMSEGHDAMGWALVENALMELATRGLGQLLKGPMSQLRSMEQQVLRDGQRLRQLAKLEKDAGRRGATFADELVEERNALRETRADRAGWFVADLTVEMVTGMASQWAARSLLHSMRGPGAEVSDDFASNVLQQGAAIMLGKRLFGLKDAWQARRAELEAQPWFTRLPEARTLVEGRTAFFAKAKSLSESISPELGAGPKLLAEHQELVRPEQDLVARGRELAAAPDSLSTSPQHAQNAGEPAPGPHAQQRHGAPTEAASARPEAQPQRGPVTDGDNDVSLSVQRLLDRPISTAVRAELEIRWQRIQQAADHLRIQQTAADPAAVARVRAEVDAFRQASSSTIHPADPDAVLASKNWQEAEQMVRDWATSREPLTISRIKEINFTLQQGLSNPKTPGELRTGFASAGGEIAKLYVSPQALEARMEAFLSWYESNASTMPPIELAAGAYQRLVSIHPFGDANGRTCRLVMDWILERHGLPPATFVGEEHNVAVYWSDAYNGGGVSPERAVAAVTKAVERTIEMTTRATLDGKHEP
jgi:hypothetical protein